VPCSARSTRARRRSVGLERHALTQSTVAELLEMDQSEVSRLEYRSDMLFSTRKRFVQATGGELHLVVWWHSSQSPQHDGRVWRFG
jgi:hypothetical protein